MEDGYIFLRHPLPLTPVAFGLFLLRYLYHYVDPRYWVLCGLGVIIPLFLLSLNRRWYRLQKPWTIRATLWFLGFLIFVEFADYLFHWNHFLDSEAVRYMSPLVPSLLFVATSLLVLLLNWYRRVHPQKRSDERGGVMLFTVLVLTGPCYDHEENVYSSLSRALVVVLGSVLCILLLEPRANPAPIRGQGRESKPCGQGGEEALPWSLRTVGDLVYGALAMGLLGMVPTWGAFPLPSLVITAFFLAVLWQLSHHRDISFLLVYLWTVSWWVSSPGLRPIPLRAALGTSLYTVSGIALILGSGITRAYLEDHPGNPAWPVYSPPPRGADVKLSRK